MTGIVRTAALSLRLLRLGGRRAWLSAGLVGAGVAVGTMLLAVALGALHGWDERQVRTGWRAETGLSASDAPAVARVRVTTDRAAGRALQIVDLAATSPTAPPPPGLARMPAPGEVWVSPALATLLKELPADRLAARFPAAPTGTITDAGLVDSDELVAIIGRAGPVPGAVPVSGFGVPDGVGTIEIYRQLTYVAAALLIFPVISLLGASARLTAARRTERLATLRLLGASTGQVTVVAVTEVTAVAAAAAIVGLAAQWLLAPALSLIQLGGSGWYADDLRPPPLVALGIVAGVTLLALLAAIGGMRQVVVGPLGVMRRQRPGSARLLRLLAIVAGLVVFTMANSLRSAGPAAFAGLIFAVGVLAMFATVSLIGPLIVRLIGVALTRTARSPARLVAGRRLLDDPRAAFRPLAGLTLAVFVAGFLAPLMAVVAGAGGSDDTTLHLSTRRGQPPVTTADVSARLDAMGIAAQVTPADPGVDILPVAGVERDRVRTALAGIAAGSAVLTEAEQGATASVLPGDLARGAFIVLIGTFLIAATSAGTSSAARVLDQRRTLRRLRLAGVPLRVLDAARRAETIRPLLVLGGIALVLGMVCASPFAAVSSALAPSGLLVLAGVLGGGVALVIAASAASRPLLRSVTTRADDD
ncbi:FtsX-like permease family protein [Pseudonocardia sp. GCM10023141]|uniref:FtsX-like permease family protein n=1 Tax=Pseudonocardia sp. GCM10023141 TaxID=3252653 RepID=UPI0036066D1C